MIILTDAPERRCGNTFATPTWVTREAVRQLEANLEALRPAPRILLTDAEPEPPYQISGAAIGSTLHVRLPKQFQAS